jgi:hypothetical protein
LDNISPISASSKVAGAREGYFVVITCSEPFCLLPQAAVLSWRPSNQKGLPLMSLVARLKMTCVLFSLMLFSGCATKITEQPSPVTPSTQRLGEFKRVILVRSEIAPAYASHEANIKAANKIDEVLAQQVNSLLSNVELKSVEDAKKLNLKGQSNVLVIKPYIKQIKFIGGAARFWGGAMAGSSVVIMDVAFETGDGKKLSNPGFMRKAGAWTDGFGVQSNLMLEEIARDVGYYVASNR